LAGPRAVRGDRIWVACNYHRAKLRDMMNAKSLFQRVGQLASPDPRWRHSPARRAVAMGLIGLVSVVNLVSLILLVHYLLHHNLSNGRPLIFAGIVLWVTNVLLFGLWYWELDRGGPLARRRSSAACPIFCFRR
jgi:hypothetical protein